MFVILNNDKQFFTRFSMMPSGRPKSHWASVQDDCVQTYLFTTRDAAEKTLRDIAPLEVDEYEPRIVRVEDVLLSPEKD